MMRHTPTVRRLLATAVLAALLPGCSGVGAVMSVTNKAGVVRPKKTVTAPVALQPLPAMKSNSFTSTTAGGNLTGTVQLEAIDESYFANSAAPYRVTALPTTLGNAMITLSTLGEDLYTQNGDVIDGLTGLNGAFSLTGLGVKDAPYVVNATFVGSHRLSAFALPDSSGNVGNLKVDEASSAIVEMARWQLANLPAGQETAMAALYTNTFALLGQMGLATDGGNIPNVDTLKVGAGHMLRNLYVAAFGGQIGAGGLGDANANILSDTWKTLLGFRPLALTRIAGNGGRGFDQGNDRDATLVPMMAPIDAVADHLGNVFIAEQDSSSLRYISKSNQTGFWGYPGAMSAGSIYTVGGIQNSDSDLGTYNTNFAPYEADASAPLMSTQPKLMTPTHLVVQQVGATAYSNVFFSSRFGNRIYMIPGGVDDTVVTVFGKTYKAGHLYVVAGNANVGDGTPASGGDAKAFALNQPTGLAMDSANNMYVLDSMEGKVRVISGADRTIHDLNLHDAPDTTSAFLADGGADLKVREVGGNVWLYVADTNHHRIVRANLGPVAGVLSVGQVNVEPVLGATDEPGYIRAGMNYPDILDVSKALSETDARLNAPTSLTFDGAGNMIVADKGRLHLLDAAAIPAATVGDTYVIAGGLDTRFITGDARLAYLPDTAGVSYDASSGNVLVVDRKENVVRKLWTARGTR